MPVGNEIRTNKLNLGDATLNTIRPPDPNLIEVKKVLLFYSTVRLLIYKTVSKPQMNSGEEISKATCI